MVTEKSYNLSEWRVDLPREIGTSWTRWTSVHFKDEPRIQERHKWRTNSLEYPSLSYIQQFQLATRSTSPDMTTLFHAWQYVRFIEIQSNLRSNKIHSRNQELSFLGGSFSNRGNARLPIQFWRESQPQHLKRWLFLNNSPIRFHVSSSSVIRLVIRNKSSCSSIEVNEPLPALISQSLVDQIQVQKPILLFPWDQMTDHI